MHQQIQTSFFMMLKMLGGAALVVVLLIGDVWAQRLGAGITAHGRSGGATIDIPINKSDVLRSDRPFYEVAVGNPEIADVQVLGDRSLYIFARKFGSTSVTLTEENGHIIAVVDINVIHDVAQLKRMLHSVMPTQRIAVRAAHDGVVLSGVVASGAIAANAMTIAERFAPGAVSNLMEVTGSQQVMLAVRFVEMRRDTVKRLGINATGSVGTGALSAFGSLASVVASPPSLAQFGLNFAANGIDFTGFLDLLEQRGAVRTLAEPTLVALSGDTADFLAGGEFPIPVGAEGGEIKIEFKKFGVGLSFTPTVLHGDLMNIKLFMEVSEPDETTDFELVGVRVPGLVVRRATTTVELRNAQSFAIAGLLSENFSDQVKQIPFIGDIPILGALTRSTEYQTGQSELVMIVTPFLAAPASMADLQTPGFAAPSEEDLFLYGDVERDRRIDPQLHKSAGFSGPHGYSTW